MCLIIIIIIIVIIIILSVGWLSGGAGRQLVSSVADPRRRDVFLGGSCGSSRWREEVAAPIFL